ncbi:CsgG/HfaB family protein [Elusimicrobiota bacterium]
MKKIICKNLLLALVLLFCQSTRVMAAGSLGGNIGKITKKFAKTYSGKTNAAIPATVAILPFDCEQKLKKNKIDFAAVEIFTKKMLETGSFKVVDRNNVLKIVEEQMFGQTGLVDPDSAAKIGELLGAKLLVMGNIAKLGSAYQISARLVDVETAEVIESDYKTIPVKVFETEAKQYMPLVPEKQSIGIYAFMTNAGNPVSPAEFDNATINVSYASLSKQFTLTSAEIDGASGNMGAGMRYSPWKNIFLDASYVPSAVSIYKIDGILGYIRGGEINVITKSSIMRANVTGRINLSKKFKGILGFGMISYAIDHEFKTPQGMTFEGVQGSANEDDRLAVDYSFEGLEQAQNVEDMMEMTKTYTASETQMHPYVKFGMEYKLQERVGIMVTYNMIFPDRDFESYDLSVSASGYQVDGPRISVFNKNYPVFQLQAIEAEAEIALCLYF